MFLHSAAMVAVADISIGLQDCLASWDPARGLSGNIDVLEGKRSSGLKFPLWQEVLEGGELLWSCQVRVLALEDLCLIEAVLRNFRFVDLGSFLYSCLYSWAG